MTKTRQWQVEAVFPNGAITTFGIRGRQESTALLRANERLAEYPFVPDQVTLERIHWRGKRWSVRNAGRTGVPERRVVPMVLALPVVKPVTEPLEEIRQQDDAEHGEDQDRDGHY